MGGGVLSISHVTTPDTEARGDTLKMIWKLEQVEGLSRETTHLRINRLLGMLPCGPFSP